MVTFPALVSDNTLDLLITSNLLIITYNQEEPFSLTCDNNVINFKLYQTFSMNIKIQACVIINEFLSGVGWISVFNSTEDINTIYSRFTNIIKKSIEKFIFFRFNKKPHLLKHYKSSLKKQTKPKVNIEYL